MAGKQNGISAPEPADMLRESLDGLRSALARRAAHTVTGAVRSATSGAGSEVTEKAKQAVQNLTSGGARPGGGHKIKITNIVESCDIGVPVDVAYDQWTRFTEFPAFMKKVEHVEQKSDEQLGWTAQILWSHRSWESKIVEQVPDERIVWTSKGDKGTVDGSVTFHELAPSLTRVVVVLAYQPRGLFEHVGNVFRAQGRRARLELKHFQRHVMLSTVLNADDLEGWRGEIHEGRVSDSGQDEDANDEIDEKADDESGGRRRAPSKQRRSTRKAGTR